MSIITRIFLVLVGVALIFISCIYEEDVEIFIKDSDVTYGRVIELKKERLGSSTDAHQGYVYYPVIEYTVNDRAYTVRHNRGTFPAEHDVGDVFEVIYEKSNPGHGMVNLQSNIDAPFMLPRWIGGILIFLGVGFLPQKLSRSISSIYGSVTKNERT